MGWVLFPKIFKPFLAILHVARHQDIVFFFSANPSDQEVLAQAAFDIRENFSVSRRFKPKEVFIVTWDRVGAYEKQTDKVSFTFLRICKGDEYVCGVTNFDCRSTLSNW